jgi:hypothetical protein
MKKQAESPFVVAIEFVSLAKKTVRIHCADTLLTATLSARALLESFQKGTSTTGHDPNTVYSVFAYSANAHGKPDRVIFQERVRPRGIRRNAEPRAAA